jgi:hypothetical protein
MPATYQTFLFPSQSISVAFLVEAISLLLPFLGTAPVEINN